MSGLRWALEELSAQDLSALPDQRAEEDFDELQRHSQAVEAERLRRLADMERRASFRTDGHLSLAS